MTSALLATCFQFTVTQNVCHALVCQDSMGKQRVSDVADEARAQRPCSIFTTMSHCPFQKHDSMNIRLARIFMTVCREIAQTRRERGAWSREGKRRPRCRTLTDRASSPPLAAAYPRLQQKRSWIS